MQLAPGTHVVGRADGRLEVRTFRDGPAQKAGHDLVIEVEHWQASVAVGDSGWIESVRLSADPDSLRVLEGRGGLKPLGELEKREIHRNIETKILQGRQIVFASTEVARGGEGLEVTGELTLGEITRPVRAALSAADDGRVEGTLSLRQTEWRIKPYSALLGALRLRDDIELRISVSLPPAGSG